MISVVPRHAADGVYNMMATAIAGLTLQASARQGFPQPCCIDIVRIIYIMLNKEFVFPKRKS